MLRELQAAFADALMAQEDVAAAPAYSAVRGGTLSAERRIDIYRHNVLANLRGALGDIYPVVKAIVGEAFFKHAAEQFIRSNPSRSGDLNQFGQGWADFLRAYPHAAELPYLPDVARLEWAWHESFHAADHAPLEVAKLADIAPEHYGELCFELHPSLRLLESVYPVFRIWEVNQPDYAGSMDIDAADERDFVLVQRDGVDVTVRQVAAAPYRFLAALATGQRLEDAADQALAADADFELQGFLIEFVQSGALVNFTLERP